MKPSIGRVVHYVSYGSVGGKFPKRCRAAIVTEIADEDPERWIGLVALNPTGQFFHALSDGGSFLDEGNGPETRADEDGVEREIYTGMCGNRDYEGGTWHWPERVE